MYKYVCTSRIDTTIFVNTFQSIEKDNIWPKIRVFYHYIQRKMFYTHGHQCSHHFWFFEIFQNLTLLHLKKLCG
jgi:hypothetical protein